MATCNCPMQLSGSMPTATLPSSRCVAALRMRRRSTGQRVPALSKHCGESLPSTRRQLQRHACKRGATATYCSASESAQSKTELEPPADSAFSPLIRQETLLFLIQLDFDRRLQRALNYENDEAAAQLREQREKLDKAVEEFQAGKGSGDGARAARQQEVASFASEGLRLRSELQRAVEAERYEDATQLQKRLKELQSTADAAAAAAAAERVGCEKLAFRLGQRVVHTQHGYCAVVCGWDVQCCEGEAWQADGRVTDLVHGAQQPWYHLLVDLRDWSDSFPDSAIAYVPQELLREPHSNAVPSSLSKEGKDDSTSGLTPGFDHPYGSLMFLGVDSVGDMVPSRELRQKYSAPRRDVGPPDVEGEDDDYDDSASGSSEDPSGGDSGGSPGGLGID